MKRAIFILLGATALLLGACSGSEGPVGPAGPAGPPGPMGASAQIAPADITCTQCHDSSTLIVSKETQFAESVHGTGVAYLRGTSADCAGCHGSEGAKERINAGLPPHDASIAGIENVSPYNCRTCHDIHTTYTKDEDFKLTGGQAPVVLEMTGGTFDSGAANLCANCHQIRNELPDTSGADIQVTSTRFGTHHGVEASMLLGEGGLLVDGIVSRHYEEVDQACVTCHMGESRNHTWEANLATCTTCHASIESFDYQGVQTEIAGKVDEAKKAFIAKGIMNPDTGLWVADTYPSAIAAAMWNYTFVVEDQSMGVHNSVYAGRLMDQVLEALK